MPARADSSAPASRKTALIDSMTVMVRGAPCSAPPTPCRGSPPPRR
jgi:hypothetical protein